MSCTETNPCLKPILRWVHSDRCQRDMDLSYRYIPLAQEWKKLQKQLAQISKESEPLWNAMSDKAHEELKRLELEKTK